MVSAFLFQLLSSFDSGKVQASAMSDMRHRILPPNFLSENPKEAGFCLWLLHPEPSLRPTARYYKAHLMPKGLICVGIFAITEVKTRIAEIFLYPGLKVSYSIRNIPTWYLEVKGKCRKVL